MSTENTADVESLNAGLNTPTDDDSGYAEDDAYTPETEEAEEESKVETEESEEVEEQVEAKKQEEDDDEPKPLTRGQQRIQALANEKKLAEQRAELLEQRLSQLEMERQRNAQPQQEDENLTDLEKWQRQADQTIRQVQFQNLDMQDRSNFLMQVSKNPLEAAYIDRVEQTLMEARKAGFNPTRDDVLIRLMGLDARSKLKQAPTVKREAAQRVTAAKGKPLVNKSNVAATKAESTEFDRLKGMIL
jgi:hypothetical protein